MLKHRLQLQTFTMSDYCILLLAVLEALDNCKPYMLRPEAVMFHEDYIFTGSSWQEVGLVYVPVTDGAAHAAPYEDLMNLAVRWAARINPVDGPALQRILQVLDKETGTWNSLQKLLLEMVSAPYYGDDLKPDSLPASMQNLSSSMSCLSSGAQPHGSFGGPASDSVHAPFVNPSQKDFSSAGNKPAPENTETGMYLRGADWEADISGEDTYGKKPRTTIIIILLALFAVAVVWRFLYLDDPNEQTLLTSIGISLLIAGSAALFCYAAGKKSRHEGQFDENLMNGRDPEIIRNWKEESRVSGTRDRSEIFLNREQSPDIGYPHKAAANEERSGRWNLTSARPSNHSQPEQSKGYGSTAHEPESGASMGAASMGPGNAAAADESTVLLAPDGRSASSLVSGQTITAYLQREFKGNVSRIELTGRKLVIGRAAESEGYVDTGEGLSRAHLEIERTTEGYSAKDLGSRNGSLLNGNVMVPYKVYRIKSEDRIQLAGAQGPVYAFTEGPQQTVQVPQGGANSTVGA